MCDDGDGECQPRCDTSVKAKVGASALDDRGETTG